MLTKPEYVKQWQFGSELLTDWNIGSEIRYKTVWEGKVFEQWGKVLDVNVNKFLQYTLFAPRPGMEDKPENYFEMNYVLTLVDGKTHLEITQHDNREGAKQEEPQGEENPILKGLKELAEMHAALTN